MLVVFVLASFAAGGIGSAFGTTGAWYDSLRKPSFTPPGWLFGPVWSALYTLMGISAWLVWRAAGWSRARVALGLFFGQLVLNAAWSVLFFGLHLVGGAFVDILLLWAAIAATALTFARHSKPAAFLMLPYLAWVLFAAVLNGALLALNGW